MPSAWVAAWLALAILLLAVAPAALAQEEAAPATVETLRDRLGQIEGALELDDEPESAALVAARDAALAVQAQATALAEVRQPTLAILDARLAELGEAPADAALETPEVRQQRTALSEQRNAVDAEIRQARLLAVEASQVVDQVAGLRRAQFQTALFQRTSPFWTAGFWNGLADSRPRDLPRIQALLDELEAVAAAAGSPASRGRLALFVLLSVLVLAAERWWVERVIRRRSKEDLPPSRLRRSARAFGITLAFTLAAWLAAHLVFEAFDWNMALPERIHALARHAVLLASFCAMVAALGRALLACEAPSWRLPPLPGEVACALRFVPLLLAALLFVTGMLERVNAEIGGSLALSVVASCLSAFALAVVLAVALVRARRANGRRAPGSGWSTPRCELAFNVVLAVGWGALAVVLVALFTGYVALGAFIAKQTAWSAIVLCLLYLSLHLVDDLASTLLDSKGRAGLGLHERFGLPPRRLDQAAVLLSGALRLLLVVLAVVTLTASYGAGSGDFLERMAGVTQGITIGQLVLSPGVVLRALLVFAIASLVIRVAQNWFRDSYLPTTALEPGMQSSLSSLLGYVGAVIAVVMALAAIGLGLERLTWIASALSVGIGFGLQAIVQNFISGVILLAERPVKVGDWVAVGDAEGDIQRINVRATEIRTGDRTTILVPNSEFITKVVRNRTHSDAEGLVSIKLPMPISTDADAAQASILEVFRAHPRILEDPAPSVSLEEVATDRMVFAASGFVSSPRLAYEVRSQLLFELLRRGRAAQGEA